MEQWRKVVGHEDRYVVSYSGYVETVDGMALAQTTQRSGHRTVKLNRKTTYVHHIVMAAFGSAKPTHPEGKRMECRHLDGNPANNHITNLAWGTVKENRADRMRLHEVGKFLPSQAREIKQRLAAGHRVTDIARDFNVDRHTVSNIKAGKTYAHIVV